MYVATSASQPNCPLTLVQIQRGYLKPNIALQYPNKGFLLPKEGLTHYT